MIEFDVRVGTPGLHDVGSFVRANARPTLPPPDLFARYEKGAFWEDRTQVPNTVRIV